ncbi:MAG: hypothetical protein ACI87N_002716 [Flavobacteriales bacterium]|jgi:hypothetical protein
MLYIRMLCLIKKTLVLLQITNTESLDSLSNLSGAETNYGVLTVIGLLVVGFTLFFLFRLKKKKEVPGTTKVKTKITSKQKPIFNQEKNTATNEAKTSIKAIQSDPIIQDKPKKEPIKEEDKPKTKKTTEPITAKVIETIKPEKEEQSREKYIGYNPINIFAQTEPLNYPYVLMPKPNCVIKFPRKGRNGRKGFKEEDFKRYIEKYFKIDFQVFDDRFILVKNGSKPYEPDFTLIDEKNGINIFLDIEIDEPYEGLNDINKRKPTHFQHADINRNNAFKNRGWIVIRFAEIQVHQEPESCCRFIADVLKSINPKYSTSESLKKTDRVKPIRQWQKEEAEKWSLERYREKYLGIENFGLTQNNDDFSTIDETEIGNKIEEKVQDDRYIPFDTKTKNSNTKLEKIHSAINSNKYLSFTAENEATVVKPSRVSDNELIAFCYVKNQQRTFSIFTISNVVLKDTYYTLRIAGPAIGLDQITNAVNTAITYHKLIRMKYTRSSWSNMIVDEETGELLIDIIEAEESIRTINDVQLAINALAQEHIEAYNLNSNYITAYCNKREEKRTFRFDRIGEIEILNI